MDDPRYLSALVLTLAVEGTLLVGLLDGRAPGWRLAAVFLAANGVTHGLLWETFHLVPVGYGVKVVGFETAVSLAEAGAFRWGLGLGARVALAASFAANTLSTVVGLLAWV